MTIRGELEDSRRCTALGLTVDAYAPVCALARQLIRAGYDPGRTLEIYRGATLCFRVRLAVAARLTVKDGKDGRPRFEKYVPFPVTRVASSVASNDAEATTLPPVPEIAS